MEWCELHVQAASQAWVSVRWLYGSQVSSHLIKLAE
jgi:hypothetical protein